MGIGINTPLAGSIRAYAGAITDTGAAVEVPSAGSGWLMCNGAAVSRTTYDDLFALVTTTYGVGDGSTTFNLPDMRGYFPVGLNLATVGNVNSGVKGGEVNHTLTTAEIPSHSHGITLGVGGAHTHTGSTGGTNYSTADDGAHAYKLGNSFPRRDGAGGSKSVGVDTGAGTAAGSFPVHPTAGAGYSVGHTHNVSLAADFIHGAAHTLTLPAEGSGVAHSNMPPYMALIFVIKI